MSGPGATPACREFEGYRRASVCLPTVARYRVALTVSFAARLLSVLPLALIIALLFGCATVPEQKVVTSVTTLPPVMVPVPVRCVDVVPPIPQSTLDPNAPVLARYYQLKADLLALDEYKIKANALLLACAAEPQK